MKTPYYFASFACFELLWLDTGVVSTVACVLIPFWWGYMSPACSNLLANIFLLALDFPKLNTQESACSDPHRISKFTKQFAV